MQEKVEKLCNLNRESMLTFLSIHYSASRIYIVQKLPEPGSGHDLYYLKHIRMYFTDAEIGSMACQLVDQLTNLHEQGIIFKYLSPKHIRVTSGFRIEGGEPIRLHLKNIAVMQLIDCASGVTYGEKICGMNSLFIAPEIENNISRVSEKADVWSLGATLYLLIAGCIRSKQVLSTVDCHVFDFSEPVWT